MGEPSKDNERGIVRTRVALSAVAVALAVVHVVWPRVRIDSITVVLLLIAVLPWLQTLFKSISTPLFSVEYREVKQRLDELNGKVESSRRLVTANEARVLARHTEHSSDADATLTELAQQYDQIRSSMQSGPARTDRMTNLVGKMLAAIEAGATVDVDRNLHSADRGERLTAYADLYARPDPSKAAALADNLIQVEDSAFGQYWALQSLRRIVEAGADIDPATSGKLLTYAQKLPRGSDRAYELDQLQRLLTPSAA